MASTKHETSTAPAIPAPVSTESLYKAMTKAGKAYAKAGAEMHARLWDYSQTVRDLLQRGERHGDIAERMAREGLPRASSRDVAPLALVALLDRAAWLTAWETHAGQSGAKSSQTADRVIGAAMTRIGKGGTEAVIKRLAETALSSRMDGADIPALYAGLCAWLAPKPKRAARPEGTKGTKGTKGETPATPETPPTADPAKVLTEMTARLTAMTKRGDAPESEAVLVAFLQASQAYVAHVTAAKGWGRTA